MATLKSPTVITTTDDQFPTTIPDPNLRRLLSAGYPPYLQVTSFIEGKQFDAWAGNALASGLGSKVIVRIAVDGDSASEVERYDMGTRIRSVLEGPEGALWVLEDERGGSMVAYSNSRLGLSYFFGRSRPPNLSSYPFNAVRGRRTVKTPALPPPHKVPQNCFRLKSAQRPD